MCESRLRLGNKVISCIWAAKNEEREEIKANVFLPSCGHDQP